AAERRAEHDEADREHPATAGGRVERRVFGAVVDEHQDGDADPEEHEHSAVHRPPAAWWSVLLPRRRSAEGQLVRRHVGIVTSRPEQPSALRPEPCGLSPATPGRGGPATRPTAPSDAGPRHPEPPAP